MNYDPFDCFSCKETDIGQLQELEGYGECDLVVQGRSVEYADVEHVSDTSRHPK